MFTAPATGCLIANHSKGEVEKKPRFTRGGPRKVGKLTPGGNKYFKGLLMRAGNENRDEETKGDEDGQ